MTCAAHLIKTAHAGRIADELLRSPVGFLAGVSAEIEATLATLDIRTIFDLATSRTFAAAERLLVAERDPASVDARLNAVPADVVDAPAGVSAAALARQPIGILRRIGPSRGPEVASVLGAPTVRDLALWPAYLAAKQILGEAFFPDRQPSADVDAPADLLPSTGMHPTERVFYRRLLIDTSPPDTANLAPIENAAAIDLVPGLLDPRGFDRLATGALLTFSQSWFSQGLTLGQLLHSTSLAPGESTRIAMVDWSRRTRAAATEDIAETEQLSNVQTHNRALSEVTSATATEVQQGRSEIHGTSATGEAGLGLGLDIGPLGFSASGAATTTDVMTSTSSFGVRDVAAEFAQTINDRTQQHASAARSRRASIVREVSQQEHETISTRVVTNYNHMHALTVQYYEIVQAFRVTTELARAERCLFVPLQLVDFSLPGVIEQWRHQLARSALTPSIARLLVEFGTVRVTSQQQWRPPVVAGGEVAATTNAGVARVAASSATPAAGETTSAALAPVQPEPVARDRTAAAPASASVRLEKAGWNVEQIAQLGQVAGRLRVSPRTRSISVSDAAVVVGVALRRGRALRFSVRRRDGSEVAHYATAGTDVTLAAGVAITELHSIAIQHDGDSHLTTVLTLRLTLFGSITTLDVPIQLAPGGPSSPLQECVRFDGQAGRRDLLDHLAANRLHYSQAIFRALDGPTIASLFARFTFRGLPLAQLVDQQPVAVSANFLVFRTNMPASGDADEPRLAGDLAAWRTFLARSGLDRPVAKSEIVPLPSGGVFAEAVLGRNNAAERLQIERFWNWQDSPIPIAAPEIAAITAGSRAQPEDVKPGQLSAPVVSIQSPVALPDPTAMAAVAAALQNANMFRDMSGLAQTAGVAQTLQQVSAAGATAATQQAGDNLLTVMDQQTQRLRIGAALVAQLYGVPASAGGGGAGPPGDQSLTEQGGQVGDAQTLDARSGGGAPQGAEAEALRNQSGSKGAGLAKRVVEAAVLRPGYLAPEGPAAPTRGVGPKQPVPRTLRMILRVSSHFTNEDYFGTTPVKIDAIVTDRDGTRIWHREGAAAPQFSGSLRTSDTKLHLDVFYTCELGWPQPTVDNHNTRATLDVPADSQTLEAVVMVAIEKTDLFIADMVTPDANAIASAITAAGFPVRQVLRPPKVTPRTGGGFNVEFMRLINVDVFQIPL